MRLGCCLGRRGCRTLSRERYAMQESTSPPWEICLETVKWAPEPARALGDPGGMGTRLECPRRIAPAMLEQLGNLEPGDAGKRSTANRQVVPRLVGRVHLSQATQNPRSLDQEGVAIEMRARPVRPVGRRGEEGGPRSSGARPSLERRIEARK